MAATLRLATAAANAAVGAAVRVGAVVREGAADQAEAAKRVQQPLQRRRRDHHAPGRLHSAAMDTLAHKGRCCCYAASAAAAAAAAAAHTHYS